MTHRARIAAAPASNIWRAYDVSRGERATNKEKPWTPPLARIGQPASQPAATTAEKDDGRNEVNRL